MRVRKRLEDERHDMILKATALNPDYKPPVDYKYVRPGGGPVARARARARVSVGGHSPVCSHQGGQPAKFNERVLFTFRAPNRKFEDKVFIPQDHHPETNFVGLLIGPR